VKILGSAQILHAQGDITSDGSLNVPGITETCRLALDHLRSAQGIRRHLPKKAVLGIGGGFVYGKTLDQTYIRELPDEHIDEREIRNIIQKVQQRSFEQIRKYFRRETARSELEVYIINAAIQEFKIDGYEVKNPVGFQGKEISVSLFNSYIGKTNLDIFEQIMEALRLDLISIASEPYALARALVRFNPSLSDVILIDIGGSVSEIGMTRKGKLEDVRAIPIGGSSFTKSIAQNLKIGFWEAENIKRRFMEGEVSVAAAKKLESIIAYDAELFARGLAVVLAEFSHLALLPSRMYLYGGGSHAALIEKFLHQKKWREGLSFFAAPTVEILHPDFFSSVPPDSKDSSFTVSVAISDSLREQSRGEDEIAKAVRRSVRLIQE
jgi:cell division protein FtsA